MSTRALRLQRRNAALARRDAMSPTRPAPARLRVATWNVNSLRARLEAVDRFLERARPDVFHPNAFTGSVYVTPAVRAALAGVLDAGLVDVDAARWGAEARRFTWWDLGMGYGRDLGMRLDVIAANRALAAVLDTTWIDHVERSMPRPSDHAALVADFRVPTRPRAGTKHRIRPDTRGPGTAGSPGVRRGIGGG